MLSLANWNVPEVVDVDLTPSDNSPLPVGVVSLWSLASFLGKSIGTGGGSGKLARLLLANQDTMCLGYIGTGKAKVCLGPKDCVTRSHERERFIFPDGVHEMVFIDAEGTNPAGWASPAVNLN